MQKIKFMTDSASDIPEKIAEKYGIEVLPFPITIGDKGYLERVDFTPQEFYKILLESPSIPVTSLVTAPTYLERFQAAYDEGYTHIILVTINSKGSSTHSAALMAKNMFYEEHPEYKERIGITILDSLSYSMGYGFPIIQAAQMAAEGANTYDVIAFLDEALDRVEIYFSVYTLEFAKKSGRIKAAAAFVGEVLGLRPVMHIIDGEIIIEEKVRGDKATFPKMIEHVKKRRAPGFDEYVLLGAMNKDMTDELTKACKKELGKHSGIFDIGAAIAINAGPKVTGIVFYGERRTKS